MLDNLASFLVRLVEVLCFDDVSMGDYEDNVCVMWFEDGRFFGWGMSGPPAELTMA